MPQHKLTAILRSLSDASVDFILAGGLAAVIQGAPIHTYDVDAVYSRAPENLERLNLLTRLGPLDLLATIGDGLTYDDLLPHTLNFESIIAIKERLHSEKDLAVLPILRRTLVESKKSLP